MTSTHAGHAPTLQSWIKSLGGQTLEASVQGLLFMLKRKQVRGDACAHATAHVLIQVVAKSKWQDVNQLLANVQKVGTRLVRAAPKELVIGNIVRRVLGLIRDEASEDRNADDVSSEACSEPQTPVAGTAKAALTAESSSSPAPPRRPGPAPLRPPMMPTATSFVSSKSMFNIFLGSDVASPTTGTGSPGTGASTPVSAAQATSAHALRSEVLDGIDEILDEMGQADDQIAGFAEVHIHPGDRVLVFQPSPTVERFILRAAAKKRFSVFIADMRPPRPGSATTTAATTAPPPPYASLRKKLKTLGVEYVVLQGMTFSPCMPLMNKVVLDAKAVVADGGALVQAGAATLARAAREHAKAVILLAGVYKLSPEDPIDPEAWTELGDPSEHVDYADGAMLDVDVANVVTEFMTPDLIDIYVTNLGTHAQNQLTTVMADHYKPEDVEFHLD